MRRHGGGSLRLDIGSPAPSFRPFGGGSRPFRPFGSVAQPSLVSHPLRTLAPGVLVGTNSSSTAGPSSSGAGGASTGSVAGAAAAERTPLLGGKKS